MSAGLVPQLLRTSADASATDTPAMALLMLGNMCFEAVDPQAARTRAQVKALH